jgi:hypothetical protein
VRQSLAADILLAAEPAQLARECGYTLDQWQAQLVRSCAPQVLACCSRQSGKSLAAAVLAAHEALFKPRSNVLLLSPSLRQSSEIFHKVRGLLATLPRAVGEVKLESALRLELRNRSRVISLPASGDTVRGYNAHLLICDEASRIDDALYLSLRPMLATTGGRIVGLSTPNGRRGWYHAAWTSPDEPWERISIPATECKRISREWLEAERRAVGEAWFQQEFMCKFVEPSDLVFGGIDISSVIDPHIQSLDWFN